MITDGEASTQRPLDKRLVHNLEQFVAKWEVGRLEVPCPVLREILERRVVLDASGKERPLASHISLAHANALYRTVLKRAPALVLEVGMAHGISSLAILAALSELNAGGRLISIDPGQSTGYFGVGMVNVRRAGHADRHTLLEEPDFTALPRLLERGTAIDFAYIDGMHTFDYTLLDFFYIDKMLAPAGVVGFNDCALPSVRKVIGYVRTHRKYAEMDVGLRKNYLTRNPFTTVKRAVFRISKADRYFLKQEQFEPAWDYWKPF